MGAAKSKIVRVVLDTNILVSALLFKGELSAFHSCWKSKRIQPLFSSATFQEFLRVLAYPKFNPSEDEIEFIAGEEVLPYFEVVEMRDDVTGICEDPDDDKFVSTAFSGGAEYLITGDGKLLSVSKYKNVRIVAPAEFMRIMK